MSFQKAIGHTGGFAISLLCAFLAINHFHFNISPEFQKYLTYDTRRLVPAFQRIYIPDLASLQKILGLLLTNAACLSLFQPTRWLGLRVAAVYFTVALIAQTYIGDKGEALMTHSVLLTACIVCARMIS